MALVEKSESKGKCSNLSSRECSGIVVEHQTPNREFQGLITAGSTMFCP